MMLLILLMSWLSGCGGTEIHADAAFPVMTEEQIDAIDACRAEYPSLNEWFPRYVKAWQQVGE